MLVLAVEQHDQVEAFVFGRVVCKHAFLDSGDEGAVEFALFSSLISLPSDLHSAL